MRNKKKYLEDVSSYASKKFTTIYLYTATLSVSQERGRYNNSVVFTAVGLLSDSSWSPQITP